MISLLIALRHLPLPLLRGLGFVLGCLLYALHFGRRRTVRINLMLCFPQWGVFQRETKVVEVFIYFVQSWLDRSWLWHSPKHVLHSRLKLLWPEQEKTTLAQENNSLAGSVIFAPHFAGLDAGWVALNLLTNQRYAGIYAKQKNKTFDAWLHSGRFSIAYKLALDGQAPILVEHLNSVRPAVQALRAGIPLYLLPDMNYEPEDSFFLPFFGNTAATLPILPRYAQLGRARVVPVVTRMTRWGYEVQVHEAWRDYPRAANKEDSRQKSEANLRQDTLRMNQELERWIRSMPAQYYWLHRRFKDQPRHADGSVAANPYDDLDGYLKRATEPSGL